MSQLQSKFLALVGVTFIAGSCYAAYVAFTAALRLMSNLDSQIATAIIAGAGTIFVSTLSIALGKVYESQSRIEKEIRDKKIPVYEDLLKFLFRVLMGKKTGTMPTEAEMIEFMSNFTQRIMVWGSDDVLAAWSNFRRLSLTIGSTTNAMEIIYAYEDLILTIRKDLGHSNRGLKRGTVLGLFVNDLDTTIEGVIRPIPKLPPTADETGLDVKSPVSP